MEQNKNIEPQALIEVVEFGPLKITGTFRLKDLKRDTEDTLSDIRLCRCGRSANKPFCDDSHNK